MAFQGFGKNSGPTGGPPGAQNPFNNLRPSPTPTTTNFPRPSSWKREVVAPATMHPPPMAFSGSQPVVTPFRPSVGDKREAEAPARMHPPPMAFSGGRPAVAPFRPSAGLTRSSEAGSIWGDRQNILPQAYSAQTHQRPPPVVPLVASRNPGSGPPANTAQVQDLKRSRSPPSQSSDENLLRNSRTIRSYADVLSNDQSHAQPAQTPPFPFRENHSADGGGRSFADSQWPAPSSLTWGNQPKSVSNFNNSLTQQEVPSHSTSIGTYDSGRKSPVKNNNVQGPKRTRSPPFPFTDETSWNNSTFIRRDPTSSSASSPKLRANATSDFADPDIYRQSSTSEGYEDPKVAETKTINFPVAKRTKLPSLPSSSLAVQDDMTRESLAKAKRLARFRDELSEPAESNPSIQSHKVAAKRQQHSIAERRKVNEESSMDIGGDSSNSNVLSEYEGQGSTNMIVGSCPDMCPESERAERERKGDLDQYERVDGDRNQTSIYLAVKKYTRTAEREAELIRPMPILQKTMDYLLNLLDQAYNDKFLGLYNFLWDRMRAIRMDLRMQHIFDRGAISMLEQMIRLHVIAMHELCEYTKGEGFSEGFDAHLNIEQMNKTSVELFQLYDDHRKKGIDVPTEKEFRGYYALLKLDKHPGYKVEPAELSLDLAKMTPDMRQTPEVLFARDVARACRTGNFIAFFRLARKASYLQACLMHAHFAKLRTQALAALHSGLQNNQGIPITHVRKWLGMEEEDIENLMEYHGFVIKEFEEPYMVKEGPFLNVDNDYPVKCSKLVHRKKASTIVEDASSPSLAEESYSRKVVKEFQLVKGHEQKRTPISDIQGKGSAQAEDENMPDYETVASLKEIVHMKPMLIQTGSQQEFQRPLSSSKGDIPFRLGSPHSRPLASPSKEHGSPRSKTLSSHSEGDTPPFHGSPRSQLSRLESFGIPRFEIPSVSLGDEIRIDHKGGTSEIASEGLEEEMVLVPPIESAVEVSQPHHIIEDLEHEEPRKDDEEAQVDEVGTSYYDEEVAVAKLKLILRLWKRRCSRKKELREQKQLATNAALSLLSLGPPIWQNEVKPSTFGHFSIDEVMSKRYEILERSWSRLNVSDVIAPKLTGKNPDAKCLCWKIVLCSQEDSSGGNKLGQRKPGVQLAAGSWLISKLMPPKSVDCNDDDDDDGLVVSSSGVSIWKKWLPSQSGADLTCCLSVVKDAKLKNLDETVAGANAVLFVLSEWLPWDLQKDRLHNLLMSLPSGSRLPLLILSGSCEDTVNSATIVEHLQLNEVDQSRVRTINVAFLRDQQMKQFGGVFSDDQLREGLQWLASESPQQPVLRCIKTRELVFSHLNASLKVLVEIDPHKVHPNQWISVFNEAVELTMREVTAAAQANPTHWPCPEIALMEESSNEYRAIECFLPNIGWSSGANISPLVRALSDSKLPLFANDISWLCKGSDFGSDIEDQRTKLESCLIKYLTESSQMMGMSLATKEVRVAIQKCAQLELHNSTYYIIPDWGMIFRRVFNWRLMSLSKGVNSSAYISVHHDSNSTLSIIDILGVKDSRMMPYHMVHPSFDEMVEVSCSSPLPRIPHVKHASSQPSLGVALNGNNIPSITSEIDPMDTGKDVAQDNLPFTRDDNIIDAVNKRGSDLVSVMKATKEADKLTQLLDKCSIMQNMIDEKLGIYF